MKIETNTTTAALTIMYNTLFLMIIKKTIIIITVILKVNSNPLKIVKSDLVKNANTVSATKIPIVNVAAISNC